MLITAASLPMNSTRNDEFPWLAFGLTVITSIAIIAFMQMASEKTGRLEISKNQELKTAG
jgi:hypothetical protein